MLCTEPGRGRISTGGRLAGLGLLVFIGLSNVMPLFMISPNMPPDPVTDKVADKPDLTEKITGQEKRTLRPGLPDRLDGKVIPASKQTASCSSSCGSACPGGGQCRCELPARPVQNIPSPLSGSLRLVSDSCGSQGGAAHNQMFPVIPLQYFIPCSHMVLPHDHRTNSTSTETVIYIDLEISMDTPPPRIA